MENNEYKGINIKKDCKYSIEIWYYYCCGEYSLGIYSQIDDKDIDLPCKYEDNNRCTQEKHILERHELVIRIESFLILQVEQSIRQIVLKGGTYSMECKANWSYEEEYEAMKNLCLKIIYPELHNKIDFEMLKSESLVEKIG